MIQLDTIKLIIRVAKEEGKLVVATNAEFPPFEYLDGTEFKGIDVDIINEYGKFIDVEVEINNGGQPIYYYIISVEQQETL